MVSPHGWSDCACSFGGHLTVFTVVSSLQLELICYIVESPVYEPYGYKWSNIQDVYRMQAGLGREQKWDENGMAEGQ